MRSVCLAVVVATSVADARVVMAPPIQRMCRGPSTWAAIAKCVRPYASAPVPDKPRATVELVVERGRTHVFTQGDDGRWRLQTSLGSGTYELAGRSKTKVANASADRIELRSHYDLTWEGRKSTVFKRTALFCMGEGGCSELVYACTAISRGKAIETFAGEVTIDADGTMNVVGDRSQSGAICR